MLADRSAHLRCGAGRTQRVVLMRDRYPEDSHDRVADELLDSATVALEDDAKVLEVPRIRARSASGSVDSPRAVEPTRSQKRTVTTLRCSRAGSARTSSAPHDMQKRASGGFSTLQLRQTGTTGVYEGNAQNHMRYPADSLKGHSRTLAQA